MCGARGGDEGPGDCAGPGSVFGMLGADWSMARVTRHFGLIVFVSSSVEGRLQQLGVENRQPRFARNVVRPFDANNATLGVKMLRKMH